MPQPVAIVTGASRGIGKATAIRLACEGYRVALLGRCAAALAETLGACEAAAPVRAVEEHSDGGGDVEPPSKRSKSCTASLPKRFMQVVTDLRIREQIQAAIDLVVAEFEDISVIVCNAGVLLATPIVDGDPSKWEEELDVNVKGTMAAVHSALPHILKTLSGVKAIIIIGSTGSQWTWPYGAGYCASKHALRGFAGSLFQEVRDKGVKVCLIMPGFTDTDMTASNPGMIHNKKMRPDDVAHAVECVLKFPESACPTEILMRPQFNCTDGTVPYTVV